MFEQRIIHPVLEDGEEPLKKRTEEEIEAEDYVMNKILVRPAITFFTVLKWGLIFCCSVLGLTSIMFYLLAHYSEQILKAVQIALAENPDKLFLILGISSFFLMSACFFKSFLIGIVHVYQRFSPEEKRRSCLFKPTCSEYAILALNKYGVIRGIPKILDRFRRCYGDKYRIDYP